MTQTAAAISPVNVTTDAATLRGTVNPGGLASYASFEYGLTTGYGSSTSPQSVGAGSADVPISVGVTGLTPGLTYHYRVALTTSVGPSNYGPEDFGQPAPLWSDASQWDSTSSTLISTLVGGVASSNATIQGYGVAIYTASSGDPTVTITNTNGWGNLFTGATFKCPAAAVPAAGTDEHIQIIQPDGSIREMWHAVKTSSTTWSCGAAGTRPNLNTQGYPTAACRGSSFVLSAGLLDPDEYTAAAPNGSLPHALSVVLSSTIVRKAYCQPSNDTDGIQVGSQYIPEGARIVLDPSANISGLSGLEKVIAQTLKTYGAIVADKTSGTEFSLLAVAPETWTALGHADKWAAAGYTGYPSFTGLVSLMSSCRIKKMTGLTLK